MTAPDPFAAVRPVADAVLYEGYVLYPYRASSTKNHSRWQFGVLMPPTFVEQDRSERSFCRTELVFEAPLDATLTVAVRFLQVQRRTGGARPEWDEAVDRSVGLRTTVAALEHGYEQTFSFPAEAVTADGERREHRQLLGGVAALAERLPGPYGARRLVLTVENHSRTDATARDDALPSALVAAHTLLALDRGSFLSMTDPPEWAVPAVAACRNEGTWPVLAGSPAVVLSAPIILGDNPDIAPESPGELYDGTEIDEILTLRTMTLTDAEKQEARATDPRAAAVIDRVDALPAAQLDRLHGALRYLQRVTGEDVPTLATPTDRTVPWWDPGADTSVSPETDAVIVDGVRVARGSKVRLNPGRRRTDAQDTFLRGRVATVEAVFLDVDGRQHVGVTADDDAELAEVQRWHGRFLYFAPDEIEPVR